MTLSENNEWNGWNRFGVDIDLLDANVLTLDAARDLPVKCFTAIALELGVELTSVHSIWYEDC